MNANSDLEAELQQLGRVLKSRESSAAKILHDVHLKRVARPRHTLPLSPSSLAGALSVAAAIFLVVGWIMLHETSASRAFAQVKETVRDLQSAVIRFESQDHPERNMKVYLLKSGQWRQEFADGLVRIYSPSENRVLGMQPGSKHAWYSGSGAGEADVWHPIRRIVQAEESAVRRLEERDGDDGDQLGFLLSEEGDPLRVEAWVDRETGLPVEVRELPATPGNALVSHRQATYRFEFNVPLDTSLFNMTPPEGFELGDSGPLRPVPAFPRGLDVSKLTLKAGVGIGELSWGANLPAVKAYFGPPSELLFRYQSDGDVFLSRDRPDNVPIDYYALRYAALGLELRLKEDTGLFAVSAEEGKPTVGVGTFPGETEESIAIGATLDEVRDRYGEPTRSRGPSDSPFALIYSDKGVAFVLADRRVTAMMVNRPGDH